MNKEHKQNIINTVLRVALTLGLGSYVLIVQKQVVFSMIYMGFTLTMLLFIFFNERNIINKKNKKDDENRI
jgi:hypothetical protein